jgi:glycosyltransferase involved in cell wall biosynthesis
MICILHGYLLEGSGSNLWTRSIVEALCRQGHDIHLMAQENHPDRYPCIVEARRYDGDDTETFFQQEQRYPGRCVLHKPVLGDLLPVFVRDEYEEFSRVVPMVELSTSEIETYLERNVRALHRIVQEHGIRAIHANHAVLMSVVAQRVSEPTRIPYTVMPHGSALEFAVRADPRFHGWSEAAFHAATRVFVIGDEMRHRVRHMLPHVDDLDEKFVDLPLGVDTTQFEPVSRAHRPARIRALTAALDALPRGRSVEQTDTLRAALHAGIDEAALERAFENARPGDPKLADEALEARLDAVDWSSDPALLYVGRLISSKGVHGVVAALPLLLQAEPELRLIIVGHGPLRELLEAMLWAMEHGERKLFGRLIARGRLLEGSPAGDGGETGLTLVGRFMDRMEMDGRTDEYWHAAQAHVRPERVLFTGYLTHRELRHLFPCCDAAVFPSVVREAGPLVFLEAMAAGVFPLGTYFGGMKASIDAVAGALPDGGAELMKLDPDGDHTVIDIVSKVPRAIREQEQFTVALAEVARARYDWAGVAAAFMRELQVM